MRPRRAGTGPGGEYGNVDVCTGSKPDGGQSEGTAGRAGPVSLEAALTAVARGDEAAFAVVQDRTAPVVLGTARRILRDPAQSEEVMQEVLVEVWRTASRLDPAAGSAAAWITMLARPRAVDAPRQRHLGDSRGA